MERSENQGPAGGVTAHLTIRDNRAAEAIEFYRRAFGAENAMEADPHLANGLNVSNGKIRHEAVAEALGLAFDAA